ncbi:MAG TPA: hypothetical protein VKP10_14380 [Gemmatimonadales bacterium]|nr:hypothetical protein [Gemmatimonadales bacterium]
MVPRLGWSLLVVATVLTAATCRLDQLVVHPEAALLCVTPSEPDTLVDSAAVGSARWRRDTISIRNCGGGELRWTASVRQGNPWLAILPDSGLVGSGSQPQAVFDPASLADGVYRGMIEVKSTTGTGVAEIPVAFVVHPCRVIPITIDDSAAATLSPADCGAPHRPGSYARIYGFPGTANDSVSIEVSSGFNAWVALDTALLAGGPLAETGDCLRVAGDPCLYYLRLPRNQTYFVEVTSAATADSGAYRLRLAHPRLPHGPDGLNQLLTDSVTTVAPGATVNDAGILLRAVVTDPDLGDSLHLEGEVRPTGTAFTGPNVPDGPVVGNGQTAYLSVAGLVDGTTYHWRVRARDNTGRSGPWVAFGGNPDFVVNVLHPPNAPTTLGQTTGDGTVLLTGATTDTNVVRLGAVVSDPDPGDQLRLEVEVRPVGTPFAAPTNTSGPVVDGGALQVTVGPLPGATSYHWRARAVDQTGDTSSWVAYGGNAETSADFSIASQQHAANLPTSLAQLRSADLSPIPVGGAVASGTVVLTGVVSDLDPTRTVQLEIEVQPVGQGFLDQPNYSSAFVPSGTTASVTVGPLAASTGYHWQARARDDGAATSAWVRFPEGPGNAETDADFVVQAPPVQLAFTVQPSNAVVGAVITPAIEVTALDATGGVVTSYSDSVRITIATNPSGGKVAGTTTVLAVAGVARFTDLKINKAGVGYTLQAATRSPVLSVISAPFNITTKPKP